MTFLINQSKPLEIPRNFIKSALMRKMYCYTYTIINYYRFSHTNIYSCLNNILQHELYTRRTYYAEKMHKLNS